MADADGVALRRRLAGALWPGAALALLWLLYSLPGTVTSGDGRMLQLPVEPFLAAALLMLAGPGPRRSWVLPLASVAGLAGVVQILDQALGHGLGRPLNPVLDAALAPRLVELATGAVGPWITALIVAGLVLALLGLFLALAWAGAVLAAPGRRAAGLGLLLVTLGGWQLGASGPFSAHLGPTLAAIAERSAESWQDRRRFARELARAPFGPAPQPRPALEGHDVIVVFIESYGRQALADARYTPEVRPALDRLEAAAGAADLALRSGWAEAPTIGGQSWLSHASFLSGLAVTNQIRHGMLMEDPPPLLSHIFAGAGWRSVLVMPAITRPWPEAGRLGFEVRRFADDLGYAGAPYNWVTMPDQYTLHAFEEGERRGEEGERRGEAPPLFAMLALISSHAPWTPLPPVLDDWSRIGDGRLFSRWADAGDPPEILWLDRARVRQQYAKAVAYSLRSLAAYLEHMRDGPFLMIAMGDHEAGAIVSGAGRRSIVPVHLIASDPGLLDGLAPEGFVAGAVPEAEAPVRPMRRLGRMILAPPRPEAGVVAVERGAVSRRGGAVSRRE